MRNSSPYNERFSVNMISNLIGSADSVKFYDYFS